ncbi:hypothetical protein GW17_00050500 [Ensete ventricosum]|nr:hypothetical protein GW17_00050500 [Ensete ventricosum]RZR90015.1 hypothetical protein BHM03_00017830 [Ensete ventricosum]
MDGSSTFRSPRVGPVELSVSLWLAVRFLSAFFIRRRTRKRRGWTFRVHKSRMLACRLPWRIKGRKIKLRETVSVLLVHVCLRKAEVENQLEHTEPREKPVEVINMSAVEIVGKPALSHSAGDLVDRRDHESVDEVADAEDAQVESHPETPQCMRDLAVEELLQPGQGERIRHAGENVPRHHPPDAHRNGCFGLIHQAELSCSSEPLRLHQGRHHDRDQRDHHSHADPLKHRDARRTTGEPSGCGHEKTIVDRNESGGEGTGEG